MDDIAAVLRRVEEERPITAEEAQVLVVELRRLWGIEDDATALSRALDGLRPLAEQDGPTRRRRRGK